MKKLFLIVSLLIVFGLLMTSCTKNKSVFGKLDQDNVYTNQYFNFSLSVPHAWYSYSDDERLDLSMGYYEATSDKKPDDYTELNTILLMIVYRDQLVEQSAPDEHSGETHTHTTPVLSPGIVINAVRDKMIPDNAVSVTVNSLAMFQEDVLTENEMYTYLYYPVNDYVILIKLNYHDESEAMLVMDVLNTISIIK
ncbi:MAG: hypothetical protein JXQ23_13975 [Clostridia bacterium]|nr:hypothetical protein [Clostridia bacterium]